MMLKSNWRWGCILVAVLILEGWLLQNRKRNYPPLTPAVDAPLKHFLSAGIRTSYYSVSADVGRPLLLIHSINASPSTYEVKPLFEHYAGERPVYSLELPGFGYSDRSKRHYSPQLFAGTIIDILRDVVQQPADVIVLSLTSEFAAMAALKAPEFFNSLTVISPTGLNKIDVIDSIPSEFIYKFVTLPVFTRGLFNLLTRKNTITYYLSRSFVGEPPQGLIDYAYICARQPDARHAPLYFLSGRLFTGGVLQEVYAKLRMPTLILYDEDPNVNFGRLPDLLAENTMWQAKKIVPSLGLPYWEKLPETVAALETFWQGLESEGDSE